MTFVIVKHGADEELLLNPNCLSAVLLDHIKKVCGYEGSQDQVDLASENGEVLDLLNKPKEYAKDLLEPRSSYILLKVTQDESDDTVPMYTPLLDTASEKIKFALSSTGVPRHRKKAHVEHDPLKPTDSNFSLADRNARRASMFRNKSQNQGLASHQSVASAASSLEKNGAPVPANMSLDPLATASAKKSSAGQDKSRKKK